MSKENEGFSFDAIRADQSGTPIFIGVAPADELVQATAVDTYDPTLSPTDRKQGYQRPPERSRITRIGTYLMKEAGNGLFPTAVLLSSRQKVSYDKQSATIWIPKEAPLQIVDGQHRLAGLKYAIEEKEEGKLRRLTIPFVVIESPDKLVEMTQFRIVNGTAKQVRTDLVNMILTATYVDTPRTDIPKKDQWRIVVSNVVDRLAKDGDSPWHDLVVLPGESTSRGSSNGKVARATSLITSLRPVYVWLKDASGILDQECSTLEDEIDYMYDLVVSYWSALVAVVPEAFKSPEDYVIQKTPGLFSLHKLLRHLLGNLYMGRREFDATTFVEFLSESPEVTDASFWHKDAARASVYGSMKGFQELYELISEPYRQ